MTTTMVCYFLSFEASTLLTKKLNSHIAARERMVTCETTDKWGKGKWSPSWGSGKSGKTSSRGKSGKGSWGSSNKSGKGSWGGGSWGGGSWDRGGKSGGKYYGGDDWYAGEFTSWDRFAFFFA